MFGSGDVMGGETFADMNTLSNVGLHFLKDMETKMSRNSAVDELPNVP